MITLEQLRTDYEVQSTERISEIAGELTNLLRGKTIENITVVDPVNVRIFRFTCTDGSTVEFSVDTIWGYGRHRVDDDGSADFDSMRIVVDRG